MLRVHAGSAHALAEVVKSCSEGRTLKLRFTQPLCVSIAATVAIEKQYGSRWQLCAHARVRSGKKCFYDCQGAEDEVAITPKKPALLTCGTLADTSMWVTRFVDACGPVKCGKVSVPPLELVREGGAHAVWENFKETMQSLNREPALFILFLQNEAGISSFVAGSDGQKLRISWRCFRKLHARMCDVVRRFVKTYVKCEQFGNGRTKLSNTVRHSQMELACAVCAATRYAKAP